MKRKKDIYYENLEEDCQKLERYMEAIELSVYEAIYKRRIKITNKNWDEENTKLFIKYIFHCNNHQLIKILETSDKEKGSQNMIQKRLIMTDWNFGELFFLELFKNKNIYNRREEVYMCDMIYKVGPILTAKAHKGRGTPQVKVNIYYILFYIYIYIYTYIHIYIYTYI